MSCYLKYILKSTKEWVNIRIVMMDNVKENY